jgi:hypothetical protein
MWRLVFGFFQTERHLFCNAAYQLMEHRRWIKRLNFIDEALFLELDKFAHDIDVMRDMNERVIEYFEGNAAARLGRRGRNGRELRHENRWSSRLGGIGRCRSTPP